MAQAGPPLLDGADAVVIVEHLILDFGVRHRDAVYEQYVVTVFCGALEMWWTVGWLCALVGMACNPVPDLVVIQNAYDHEESAGSTLHDKNLQVLKARCHDADGAKFLCEVMFISKGDPAERLYFDIVAVARTDDGWQLKSGLCKR